MEQPGVVVGNFAGSFSLIFLSILVHISGSIRPVTLIWASLERCFPPAQVEYRCQFWSKGMTSEVEERPRLIMAGYGRLRSQWVKSKFPQDSKSVARLEKLNSPYSYVGLSKSKNAMCFLSSNISVFSRKTTLSISHPGINLVSPNRVEKSTTFIRFACRI